VENEMKITLTKLKYYLAAALFLAAVGSAMAQSVHRDLSLKKGDEFQRQIVIKSNCLLQRGSQKLNLSTYSSVSKNYKVNNVTGNRANVVITINKIIDSINALGQKVAFNSEKRPDPDSFIQMALLQMIGKPAMVSVDEKGKIIAIGKQSQADDTLLSFTGIQNEALATGHLLDFTTDFPANPFIKKGYSWTDSTASTVTRFTIYTVNDRTTTITYTSTTMAGNLNSRINGVMLVDNGTGLILKRSTQSVTTGYELVKGVIYTATRRTATSEVCYKIPEAAK
jgi:hypothetical protein